MTDRPILFSAPMIRALLEGRKTQTRRILKPQPKANDEGWDWTWTPRGDKGKLFWTDQCILDRRSSVIAFLPYQVGDRLWVRESLTRGERNSVSYMADGSIHPDAEWVWRNKSLPSIHCPRGLSRIKLIVKDVRVERLQDISEEDAKAEGLIKLPATGRWAVNKGDQYFGGANFDPRKTFADLWDSINGAKHPWTSNPWVSVTSFDVILANIDSSEARRDGQAESAPREYRFTPSGGGEEKHMITAHIDRQTKTIDGVTFKNTHSGQKRAYGDSFYEYEVQSERPAAEVEKVCAERVYKAIPESEWLADTRAHPGDMDKAFRAHYTFKDRGGGKYFYSVRFLYTD